MSVRQKERRDRERERERTPTNLDRERRERGKRSEVRRTTRRGLPKMNRASAGRTSMTMRMRRRSREGGVGWAM
eukprot:5169430-Pyramimonas_sp.AAC.1